MTTDPQEPAPNDQTTPQDHSGQQAVASDPTVPQSVIPAEGEALGESVQGGSPASAAGASSPPMSASNNSASPVAETPSKPVAEPTASTATSAEPQTTPQPDPGAAASAPATPLSEPAGALSDEAAATADTVDGGAHADQDSASRIREKMMAAEAQGSDGAAAPTHRESSGGSRRVEIPGADDLEAGLEAEIQAVMEVTSAPAAAAPPAATGDAAPAAQPAREVGQGSKVKGTVQQIHGDDVFLEAGLRTNVVVSLKQFGEGKTPEVGAQVDVIIEELDADGLIRGRLPKGRHKPAGNWDNLAVGQVIDCLVTAVNKGGLQVTVGGLRAFMPASQVELGFAGDLESYVGQKISAQVTEVNPKKRNLVVSRRALLQEERAESEGEFWAKAEVGQDFSGVVKTIKDYGAFVNIGPVDGFLHIGEISWSRINHPSDALAEGQTVDVKVLRLDPEKRRVSLGMKQLAQNPWSTAAEKYATGRTVTGTVSRVTDFGAFVELEPGLEGMVHISELAWRRVGSVSEVLNVGDTKEFQVQEVDTKRKRVSLSLKALEKRPESARPDLASEPEAPAEPRRPRNTNLRGGTSSDEAAKRGGLFGNPSDFS